MSTPVKKVLKKKAQRVADQPVVNADAPVNAEPANVEPANVEPVIVPEPLVNVVEPVNTGEVVELTGFIPSSRVHNYVSGVKLNKEYDDMVNSVKTSGVGSVALSEEDLDAVSKRVESAAADNTVVNDMLTKINSGVELSAVLSTEDQAKVGELIKQIEAKNEKSEEKQPININDITVSMLNKRLVTPDVAAVEIISKKRAKFSKESFDVLSTFSDMVICEIAKFTLDRLVEVGNSTIEPKYIFSSNVEDGELYGYYSNLPSYKKAENEVKDAEAVKEAAKKAKKEAAKKAKKAAKLSGETVAEEEGAEESEEVVETSEVVESVECAEGVEDKKINFKFYIKSIVYKLKETNPSYVNAKVSDRFQTLCSDIILDILDDAVALSQIILQVMSTKTISAKLFKSCLYTKLYSLPSYDSVKDKLDAKF